MPEIGVLILGESFGLNNSEQPPRSETKNSSSKKIFSSSKAGKWTPFIITGNSTCSFLSRLCFPVWAYMLL